MSKIPDFWPNKANFTNLKTISTQLKKIVALLLKNRREGSFWPKLKSFTESRWFNFYGTLALVLLVLIFKGTSNGQDTLFSNLLKKTVEETSASIIIISQSQNQLADINSLMAYGGQGQGGTESTLDPSTVQENSFQASSPASTDYIDGFKADQVIKYTVQSGDTIGSIASDFGDNMMDTIIWANNIRNPNALSLGQVLKIPPVRGVIHTVKPEDTVASIAKKYKADANKILSFNKISDDKGLIAGNEVMVPDGQLPGPKPSIKPSLARGSTDDSHGIYVPVGNGQCVDFVQAHGFPKLSGNANTWKRYINTPVPVAGGVVVFRGGRFGHVALITAVKTNSIQVVEQNYYSPYVIDHREISLTDRSIVGFIQ
jgi:LysM repeat protein